MFHVKHFSAKPFARHQYWLDNASAVKWSGGIIVRWLDRHIWIDVAGRPNHAVFRLGSGLFALLGGIFWGSNFFGDRAILSNSRRSRAEKGGRDRRKPSGGRSKFSSLVFLGALAFAFGA
jgi:hypothetical protein